MSSIDPAILDAWHVVAAVEDLSPDCVKRTRLTGTDIAMTVTEEGQTVVWKDSTMISAVNAAVRPLIDDQLPTRTAYGLVWTSLGRPAREPFAIPEYQEMGRRNIQAGSFAVHVSAPRAIENFLDMGHFPFVHTNYLGTEEFTEVLDYKVEIDWERDEVIASECRFFQPKATLASDVGANIDYVYRVPHPYCAILYKTSGDGSGRKDVIGLFAQPIDEEHTCAHMTLSCFDHESDFANLRAFQQTIFAQDKPILENQMPKRLPIGMKADLPARADASSMAYRRWLRDRGVRYGTS